MSKLSDRVRAGSEAAPWVVEEIEKLERELASSQAMYEAGVAFHKVACLQRDAAWRTIEQKQATIEELQARLAPAKGPTA